MGLFYGVSSMGFFYGFAWSNVGDYKVYVENEFGSASKIIKLDMAGEFLLLVSSIGFFYKCLQQPTTLHFYDDLPH